MQVIINNAAVPMFEKLTRTEQGFEAQFGANHLGHFLFTSLIFRALRSAATPEFPARVVNVSSIVVTSGSEIRWDDVSFELRPEEYGKYSGYTQSKLANVLFSRELAKRYKSENIISFSLHPGGTCVISRLDLDVMETMSFLTRPLLAAIFDTNMGGTVSVEEGIALGKPPFHPEMGPTPLPNTSS